MPLKSPLWCNFSPDASGSGYSAKAQSPLGAFFDLTKSASTINTRALFQDERNQKSVSRPSGQLASGKVRKQEKSPRKPHPHRKDSGATMSPVFFSKPPSYREVSSSTVTNPVQNRYEDRDARIVRTTPPRLPAHTSSPTTSTPRLTW